MSFTTLSIEEVDVSLSALLAKSNNIQRVSGGAIILGFRLDDPYSPHVLLCQRSPNGRDDDGEPKMNSFPGTWESPGGGALPEDRSILETMVRETAEETGLVLWAASNRVYCVTFRHKDIWMAKYLAIAETSEKTNCGRLWSDEHDGPRGSDENPIRLRDDEHLDYVWATEQQVRNPVIYEPSDANKTGLAMMQSNKDVLLDFFSWLKEDDPCMAYPLPELPLKSDRE
ncbi:hypothetical protein N7481_010221 [Penicillium waksmanii]|uniref:uncharacterized protein n=1 Tax=Penicillium waksmanii TaxID=69791 RepID=UPI0025470300|nr:uncharacterized protein N7481_010221 [Penicillium waksmanii]KAJ5976514.1 hypothetical protein N7481_010221 [Penicillium waksmanii]